MPVGEVRVAVSINLGEPFDDWVDSYHRSAVMALSSKGGHFTLELNDFRKYVMTLICARIDYVNAANPVVKPFLPLRVPTLVHVALQAIGEAETEQTGVIFVPTHDFSRSDQFNQSEMIEISDRLADLEWAGFNFANGYDRDSKGAYDLMAMQYLQGTIRDGVYSHDRSPAIAFAPVAYFLGLKQLHSLLGERVIYADEVTLNTRLKLLSKTERKAS
jgi:hypothetical protein